MSSLAEIAELRARWHQLLSLGALNDPEDRVLNELIEAYSQPERRHHTTGHLLDVLRELDRSRPLALTAAQAAHVTLNQLAGELAAFFHDAVYFTDGDGSEGASAALARELLPRTGASSRLIGEVCRLVELTAEHQPEPADVTGAWLSDADLIVLASDPGTYERYRAAVRDEYRKVPDDLWRQGRGAVLRKLLGRPLFHLPGRERDEQQARRNMRAELATLS